MHRKPLMPPNVEFQIGLSKTNPGLAKSQLQQKTCGYVQKTAPNNMYRYFERYVICKM